MNVVKNIDGKVPIKIWTDDIETEAMDQLINMSKLPFIHKHIAVMPDVHAGKGSTIGSVIPTKGVIIPAAVGVDIGCGMMAVKTTLTADDLPDNLASIRSQIEAAIPHGRTDNGGKNDKGCWTEYNQLIKNLQRMHFTDSFVTCYGIITGKHPAAKHHKHIFESAGTLGTGNHFIEICLDESDVVWIMLHTGSRGPGNKIGSYFIQKAKEEMARYHITEYLPDKDLAYLVEYSALYDDYIDAVQWAQKFAEINRMIMMELVLYVLQSNVDGCVIEDVAINCHHNYVARENHFGANVNVTRKGAIRARKGDLGIIPGSMGGRSYIVKGLGNAESFNSCSHGAGRRMSRTKARELFSADDLIMQTMGIECPKDESRVDEIPAAYKNIDGVMHKQRDLVEVLHTLKQVINIKG